MENVHRCCCGLDVDKKNVAANLLRRSPVGTEESDEVRRFATTTGQLLEIADDRLVHRFHELPSDLVPPRRFRNQEIVNSAHPRLLLCSVRIVESIGDRTNT